jgi:hypothetical protein
LQVAGIKVMKTITLAMMLMTGPTQAKLAYLVVIMAGSGLKSAHKGKDYI